MIRVAIVQRRLAHYRLPLYEQIVRDHPEIVLTLYCGRPDQKAGGSGIPLGHEDPQYVKRIRNYGVNVAGRPVVFQPRAFWNIWRKRYDVVVYEASMMVWSSIILLAFRRRMGYKNILWLKGWPHLDRDSNIVKRLKKKFLCMGDGYIVYGETSKKSLICNFGIRKDMITVAQNTVDVRHLLDLNGTPPKGHEGSAVVEAILREKHPYIFNIGRLVEKKRLVDLLHAFWKLDADPRFHKLRLVIAGDGPDRPYLEQLASKRQPARVIFLGQISDTAMTKLFQASVCCVFPGAVGLALNQAMASAKPVVCADEPGPDAELLIDKENGLRYKPGNLVEMVEVIKVVLSDRDMASQLGTRARETIRARATMENMARQYVSALHRALDR